MPAVLIRFLIIGHRKATLADLRWKMFAKQVLYEDKNIQIRSESKDIATNLREIKRVITEYYEQVYAPKLNNRQIPGST